MQKVTINSMQVHYSSASSEWNTPPEIIEGVIQVMDEIDLDPCSDTGDPPNVPARHHYTAGEDGLSRQWYGRVYMNPPYGREIVRWSNHLRGEYAEGRTMEAVALVPARVDTKWWRTLTDGASVCFIQGRLKFGNGVNSAPFPSAVVYLGPNPNRFAAAFGNIGTIYQLNPSTSNEKE